jgi:hypothetical protein
MSLLNSDFSDDDAASRKRRSTRGQSTVSRYPDLYPDRVPPSQPATNVGKPRASANDYQTVYARTVPPRMPVSRRGHAYYPRCSPVLTYVTVCTFAGLLAILDVPPSHIFTPVCLQAPATSVDHPRATSMPLNNACNISRLCSASSCRQVTLAQSASFPTSDKTNLRGRS